MALTPTREQTQQRLERRAEYAALKACEMMTSGSREYDHIQHYVEEYMSFRYAADALSGQTESSLGDLDE